jgi:nitrate/TMAO reductase-like tetraheme cytochrome c subunit
VKRISQRLKTFFFPPPDKHWTVRVLPYAVLGILTLAAISASAYGWDYTNSPPFCGTTCHTMPPEYTAYQISPHANIACVDCHIGKEFIGNQVLRKAGDVKHIIALAFKTYEFPITAHDMRPARETCEKCHSPDKFSDDSLRQIFEYGSDAANTPTSITLVVKTGGGAARQGLGKGIHWHIQNKVLYYPTDKSEQTIPYVRVYNDDGSTSEYVDLASGVDPSKLADADLKEMDCITCHNRITHLVNQPEVAIDQALQQGLIDVKIPEIKRKGVEVLRASYPSTESAINGIAGLNSYYEAAYPDFYAAQAAVLAQAIAELQSIYRDSVFVEQKSDWSSHPNNVGHQYSPGCFRCHDGKHLDAEQHAIRLECNLCHSIPAVTTQKDLVTRVEIPRGPEPTAHKNPNWIVGHSGLLDRSCSACHTTGNPGGTDNSSFCSNSACHGSAWKYAGLDAPGLAAIVAAQLPAPTELPPVVVEGVPTYDANIQPIFVAVCGPCHGENQAAGLTLTDYASTLHGSTSGAVILPGDSKGSRLVTVQQSEHFANLTADELAVVIRWIDGGAMEK